MSVKEAIEENGDTLSSMLTEMQNASRHSTIPDSATPFSATNATALAIAATPQEVKAAVASKRHFITEIFPVNITTAEKAITFLQDEDDVISAVFIPLSVDAAVLAIDKNPGKITFNPPLVIASGKAIEIHVAGADVGDVFCTVNGYVEA